MANNRVNYTFNWKIDWSNFANLATKKITKRFITSRDHVVFHWKLELSCEIDGTAQDKFTLSIYYEDGPLPEIKDVQGNIELFKDKENRYVVLQNFSPVEFKRGCAHIFVNFGPSRDTVALKTHHGLGDYPFLIYHPTFKIPISVFQYRMENNAYDHRPTWISSMYAEMENPNDSVDSDVQLISGEGKEFYCHKVILRRQSDTFDAMFRNPKSEEEKADVFRFKTLHTDALKGVLEYLYVGKVKLDNYSTAITIEIADFAEGYQLRDLKSKCGASLWQRVVKNSEECAEIIRFADLHDDMKYLKDRAFDVFVDAYDETTCHAVDGLVKGMEENRADRLRNELMGFILRRLDMWYG